MQNICVLDASVALAICFPDEQDNYADEISYHLTRNFALVPDFFHLETANAFFTATLKRRFTLAEVSSFRENMYDLLLRTAAFDASSKNFFSFSTKTGLPIYDSVYLALAQRERLPLATLDEKMKKAARNLKIPLFPFQT